jgi:hypothetical protein
VENTNNSLTAVAAQEGPSVSVVGDTCRIVIDSEDLLTNTTIVDDAIRFVTENRNKNGLIVTEESKAQLLQTRSFDHIQCSINSYGCSANSYFFYLTV